MTTGCITHPLLLFLRFPLSCTDAIPNPPSSSLSSLAVARNWLFRIFFGRDCRWVGRNRDGGRERVENRLMAPAPFSPPPPLSRGRKRRQLSSSRGVQDVCPCVRASNSGSRMLPSAAAAAARERASSRGRTDGGAHTHVCVCAVTFSMPFVRPTGECAAKDGLWNGARNTRRRHTGKTNS